MTKIFLDTSVFIRFLTKDDQEKYRDCMQLFTSIEQGKFKPYTSNIVILEIIFVLTRIYRFPKNQALDAIDKLFNLRNLTVLEKTNTIKAIELFRLHSVKYPDCLIATQVPASVALITYDAEFSLLPDVKSLTPSKLFK